MNEGYYGRYYKCPICKEKFFVGISMPDYMWKINRKGVIKKVCSYSCMRKGENDVWSKQRDKILSQLRGERG